MVEVIETATLRVPFRPEIITPAIERPLRRGRYEGGELLAAEAVIRPGDRVLELGAGLGLVSARAAQLGAEVTALEANPDLIPLIRETHGLSGVADRVRLVNAAVTPRPAGPLPFYRRRDFWASSLSPAPAGWIDETTVATRDIAALIEETRPTVIVCDIEGGERGLFAGADLSGVRALIVEIHPKVYGALGVKQLFDDLSAQGFGYAPKASRGGSVVTFQRAGRAAGPRVFVPTCMKNEGAYIVEWLAFHRVVGVTDFAVFTNNCEDGTDALLDRLQALGMLRHLPNPAQAAGSPHFQPVALAYAALLPEYRAADYVISMDVDEFLNIHAGDGTVAALIEAAEGADAISLSEALFAAGASEGLVTEDCTMRAALDPPARRARRGVKTLFRPGAGLALKNHRPRVEGAAPDWRDGSGAPVPAEFAAGDENGMDCRGRYGLAALNHYALRSPEAFLIKHDRGDVVSASRRVSARYWRARNRAEEEDRTILRHAPAVKTEMARILADPEVARLHELAQDWHRRRAAELVAAPDHAELAATIGVGVTGKGHDRPHPTLSRAKTRDPDKQEPAL